jgi:hypothetical protein
MTRRRLILAACVAVVALGAAWWLYSDGLSAEERRLVGTWNDGLVVFQFTAGHRCEMVDGDNRFPGRWSIRGDCLVIDFEQSAVRRALRPLASLVKLQVGPVIRSRLEWTTENEVTAVTLDGGRGRLSRVRGD